ncbi:MAG: hypothetical protein ACRDY2_07010 [Acidimicrobiales bacterium]
MAGRIGALAARLCEEARKAGRTEPRAAHAADALVELVCRADTSTADEDKCQTRAQNPTAPVPR